MPKRLYICEICGHHKSLTSNGKKQIVCIDCVERDLLALNDRIKRLEKRFALHEKCKLSVDGKCKGNFSPLDCNGIDTPEECKEMLDADHEKGDVE